MQWNLQGIFWQSTEERSKETILNYVRKLCILLIYSKLENYGGII